MTSRESEQRAICALHKVKFCPAPVDLKLGIAVNVQEGLLPINGLRHPPEGDTSGWFIYAGEEFSDDPNLFKPLHIKHIPDWCPQIDKYLGLPPGWRFLLADDYEDVWYDESLLKI